jgi:hypothetical protein
MGRVRTRRALTVGAAVLAAAATGCGSDDKAADKPAAQASPPAATATTPSPAPATPADAAPDTSKTDAAKLVPVSGNPIARAAAVARAHKGGIAVTMRGTIQAKGVETTVTGKGSIDRTANRGSFTSTTGIHGQKIVVRQVMDGHSVYLTSDAFKGRLPGGKSWMKIDLAKAAKTKNFDLSAFGTNGPSQDPSQVLDYLAGAGKVRSAGTETIHGVKATRYRLTADLKRAKARSTSKAAKTGIDQLLGTLDGTTKVPVDVWIDAEHRVLRERVRYTADINGEQNQMDFTTDFTGFGVDVTAAPPAGKDTVDGLDLLRKAQKARAEAEAAAAQKYTQPQG